MNLSTPSGFRDVLPQEALARERITSAVQALFAEHGYSPIETPTLEAMDVMGAAGRIPDSPFKFYDSRGDLLVMRPDVTIQIARMCATRLANAPRPIKLRYTQRVFREAESRDQALTRELTQMGVECIGDEGPEADAEIVGLFARALACAGVTEVRLALATVGVFRALLERSGAPEAWKAAVTEAYHRSNFVELERLTRLTEDQDIDTSGIAPAYAEAIGRLSRIRGGREAIEEVRELVSPLGCAGGLDDFERTYDILAESEEVDGILVDFSIMSSFDYYTGIVFAGYSPFVGTAIGSGGRYDDLTAGYGVDNPAAGFAFYLELAMQAADAAAAGSAASPRPLRIAVPKGALYADSVDALSAIGLDTAGLNDPGRLMVISNPGVEFIIVRPSDAPIFVALGAADCGICGKDSLLEAAPEVVELADLSFGACRFVVAEPEGACDEIVRHYEQLGSMRIATKYPRITREHFAKTGTQVEIVYLHGNIELAPLTGMAERIVDITATGTTLRENNLRIVDEVLSSTAQFFANPAAFRTDDRIMDIARSLKHYADGKTYEPIAGSSQPTKGE